MPRFDPEEFRLLKAVGAGEVHGLLLPSGVRTWGMFGRRPARQDALMLSAMLRAGDITVAFVGRGPQHVPAELSEVGRALRDEMADIERRNIS